MNHILEQLSKRGSEDLNSAIEEKEAEILKAIQHQAGERKEQGSEAPLKFSLSLKITADLDKSVIETAFSYSVKTTVKGLHEIKKEDEDDDNGTPSLFFGVEDGEEDA